MPSLNNMWNTSWSELTTEHAPVSHCGSSDEQVKQKLSRLLSCYYSVISRVSTGIDHRLGRVWEQTQWNCLQVQDRDPLKSGVETNLNYYASLAVGQFRSISGSTPFSHLEISHAHWKKIMQRFIYWIRVLMQRLGATKKKSLLRKKHDCHQYVHDACMCTKFWDGIKTVFVWSHNRIVSYWMQQRGESERRRLDAVLRIYNTTD